MAHMNAFWCTSYQMHFIHGNALSSSILPSLTVTFWQMSIIESHNDRETISFANSNIGEDYSFGDTFLSIP